MPTIENLLKKLAEEARKFAERNELEESNFDKKNHNSADKEFKQLHLTNTFIAAMPQLDEPTFAGTLIYIYQHNSQGAAGLIINKKLDINLGSVFERMNFQERNPKFSEQSIYFGGPVKLEHGFILHKPYKNKRWESTLKINENIAVTTSRDILNEACENNNVGKMLVALGQATWMPGQLEYEIQNNFWLTLPINYDIIFETPSELRYDAALEQFGFNSYQLVGNAARA